MMNSSLFLFYDIPSANTLICQQLKKKKQKKKKNKKIKTPIVPFRFFCFHLDVGFKINYLLFRLSLIASTRSN